MTTTTETPTVDLSTSKKVKAYLKSRVKEYYEELGAEDVYVKVSRMRWEDCIDPMFIGQMWTIIVRYRDDDVEAYVYQTKTVPDPWHVGKTTEARLAFIESNISDLQTSYMYLSGALYNLEHK
jgi:hypothetical protein